MDLDLALRKNLRHFGVVEFDVYFGFAIGFRRLNELPMEICNEFHDFKLFFLGS